MIKTVNFFRYDSGNYHPFSLMHYLSIKSFLHHNPTWVAIIWTNKLINNGWYYLLDKEYPHRITQKLVSDTDVSKYDYVSHYVDALKVQVSYENGGLYLDTDFISMDSVESLIDPNKFNICNEFRIDGSFYQYVIGMMYCNPKDPFIEEWMKEYKNYKKGMGWTYYAGEMITKILEGKDFHVIDEDLISPWSAYRLALNDLFIHNHDVSVPIMFHTSESAAWDRYIKHIDIEHIMTIDTTFTKLVRQYVSHLWDDKNHRALIRFNN